MIIIFILKHKKLYSSIVYFYSSLARFLLVGLLFLFLYALQVSSDPSYPYGLM